MVDRKPITILDEYLNQQVEIIAFGIAYRGILTAVDWEHGALTLIDDMDRAIIEIERVEDFRLTSS